jgi:hypothetical protein
MSTPSSPAALLRGALLITFCKRERIMSHAVHAVYIHHTALYHRRLCNSRPSAMGTSEGLVRSPDYARSFLARTTVSHGTPSQ